MTGTLVLLRHGSSEWNAQGVFTGWIDVPLAEAGRRQARRAGQLLADAGIRPDAVHTSLLARAVDTAELAAPGVPAVRSWRLNERHYGALQGREKRAIVAEYGRERFAHWRRSWHGTPPPLPDDDPRSPVHDPRYADLGPDLPRTESLADVHARLLPHWTGAVRPLLAAGANVLLTAHSNTLRALIKHLDDIPDDAIDAVNVPTGIPLVYRFTPQLHPRSPATYLDPAAAGTAAAAVAREGLEPHPAAEPAKSHRTP